jgi:hypothetical protein
MNLRQAKTEDIALLLHGLRAICVTDLEERRQRLIQQLEGELSSRGLRLPEAA